MNHMKSPPDPPGNIITAQIDTVRLWRRNLNLCPFASFILTYAVLSLAILITSSPAWAKERDLGFIVDDKGEIRKVVLHTSNEFTLGKGFPFIEKPVAVSVTEASSK